MISRIHLFFNRYSKSEFLDILLISFLHILISLLFSILKLFFGVNIGIPLSNVEYNEIIGFFFKIVILAPLLETFFFQYLPMEYLLRSKNEKEMKFIVISGLLFGILHYFNRFELSDAVFSSLTGILFSYLYLFAKYKKYSAYFFVCSVHAFYNLYVFILITLSKLL